ncbi:MAG: sulfatase-like hydrolase/transferase [Phycisphaerae bacterium]
MPNLLFLYTDEQRFDTFAATGNDRIDMPHLNKLASMGTTFTQTYCTQPVCTPSRGSIVSGLWPTQHGAEFNNMHIGQEIRCLPELLPAGQYATGHFGKWHLGDEIYAQHGFEDWRSTEDTYHAFYSEGHEEFADRSSYHHWLVARGIQPEDRNSKLPSDKQHPAYENRFFRGQIHAFDEEHCRPAYLGNQGEQFIRDHADHPWVLYINFLEPHMPFTSCRDDQYSPEDVFLPENYIAPPGPDAALRARHQAARYKANGYDGQRLSNEQDWRELTARYWGMNSLVDTHAGRILAALEETGQLDDTIIVWTSDHGDMMASHRIMGKGLMYEESARVPLVIRLPGQSQPRRVDCPVSQIDLVPTLLEAMGHDGPDDLPGGSLLNCARGRDDQTGRNVYFQWNKPGSSKQDRPLQDWEQGLDDPDKILSLEAEELRCVVTPDGWKLNLSSIGEHELYDLTNDRGETRNVLSRPDCKQTAESLVRAIHTWQDSIDDSRHRVEL